MTTKHRLLLITGCVALPFAALFTWLALDDPGARQSARLRSSSGLVVHLLVKRPVPGQPAPLVLILGGHHTGRDAARLIPDSCATRLASSGATSHSTNSTRKPGHDQPRGRCTADSRS